MGWMLKGSTSRGQLIHDSVLVVYSDDIESDFKYAIM